MVRFLGVAAVTVLSAVGVASAADTTRTFQQGVNGYQGSSDAAVSWNVPSFGPETEIDRATIGDSTLGGGNFLDFSYCKT